MKGTPHSAGHFGTQRDHWWNNDFLALMGQRVRSSLHGEAKTLLDVGAGRCHWTAIAARWFPTLTKVVVSDVEETWVNVGKAAFAERYGVHGFEVEALEADAVELPFPDDSFDVVTCQTVMMHLKQPDLAIREMARVTRPGGVVIVAEPANFRAALELDSASLGLGLEPQTRRMRLWLACRLGRRALGEPDFEIGERLVPLLNTAMLEGIKVVMNNRVRGLTPPYQTAEQQTLMQYMDASAESILSPSGRLAIRRLATAGGMRPEEVNAHIEDEATHVALRKSQILGGRYVSGGAPDMFIAWGTRG